MADAIFLIPEIVGRILSCLGPSDLASCARVNQSWFNEAGRHLWVRCGSRFSTHPVPRYKGPGIDCLASLQPNTHRMQRYANFIESFDFDGENACDSATRSSDERTQDTRFLNHLTNIQFPRLKSVDLGSSLSSRPVRFQHFRRFLVPNLESFSIKQGILSNDFFEYIQVRTLPIPSDKSLRSRSKIVIDFGFWS